MALWILILSICIIIYIVAEIVPRVVAGTSQVGLCAHRFVSSLFLEPLCVPGLPYIFSGILSSKEAWCLLLESGSKHQCMHISCFSCYCAVTLSSPLEHMADAHGV